MLVYYQYYHYYYFYHHQHHQMYRLGLEKAEEPEIKLSTFVGHWRKQRNSRKSSTSASLSTLKHLLVWITTNCAKFLKRSEYQILYESQEATIRTRHGTMDWFKIGKGVCQGCIQLLCLFNYMQSTSFKMPGWMNHKLESRLLGEISATSDMQMIPL